MSRRDISADLGERHCLAALDLSQSFLNGIQGAIVREDLGCLFKGVVLVDRNQDRGGPAASCDDHVLAQVGNPIDEVGKSAAQLADRYGFSHGRSVPY